MPDPIGFKGAFSESTRGWPMMNLFTNIQKFNNRGVPIYFYVLTGYILFLLLIRLFQPIGKFVQLSWVINYSDGFTRRGLLGTIIAGTLDSSLVLPAIDILAKLILIVLIAIYLYLAYPHRHHREAILVLLLSPALILFPLNDRAAIGRFEQIGILVTIIHAFLIRYALSSRLKINQINQCQALLIASLPILPLALLLFIHEAMFLMVVPINLIITYLFLNTIQAGKDPFRTVWQLAIVYLPVWCCFVYICIFHHAGPDHALNLCENIKLLQPDLITKACSKLPKPLSVYQFSLYEHFQDAINYFGNMGHKYTVYCLLGILLSIISIVGVSRIIIAQYAAVEANTEKTTPNRKSEVIRNKNELAVCASIYFFFLPLLCITPLFIIAKDWGRWFFAANIQFVLVTLIFVNSQTMERFQFPFFKSSSGLRRPKLVFIDPWPKKIHLALVVFFIIIKLPHWCGSWRHFFQVFYFIILPALSLRI